MSQYRALVHATSPGFLVTAFLARLPAAMAPLGVLTLVATVTGSFAVAGAVAAAYGAGATIGGPIVGALVDRFGQRSVGLVTAVVDAAALVGVVLTVHDTAVVAVITAAAGFATPQIGPLVRVRWSVLLGDRGQGRMLTTAFSYEGVADELSYLAGPAIIGVLGTTGPAGLPLMVAAGLTLFFAIPFALHPTAPPVVRVPFANRTRSRLPVGPLAILVLAMLAVGMVFGATQTGVTAFAEGSGHPGSAGLIYAVLAVGSALAGLATGWLPARIGPVTRYVWAAAALAVAGCSAMLLSGSLGGLLVAIGILGITCGPYLIAAGGLAILVGPRDRAGSVMTLVAAGVVAGGAVGAAAAGRLADASGASGAFIVPAAAGLLAVVLAAASGRLLRARAHAGVAGGDGSRGFAGSAAGSGPAERPDPLVPRGTDSR